MSNRIHWCNIVPGSAAIMEIMLEERSLDTCTVIPMKRRRQECWGRLVDSIPRWLESYLNKEYSSLIEQHTFGHESKARKLAARLWTDCRCQNRCWCFQHYIKHILDTLIPKLVLYNDRNKWVSRWPDQCLGWNETAGLNSNLSYWQPRSWRTELDCLSPSANLYEHN